MADFTAAAAEIRHEFPDAKLIALTTYGGDEDIRRALTAGIPTYLIDYPVAIVLIAAPFVLNLGQSGPVAIWLSVVAGLAALLLAALTDHPTGLVHIIPYWLHLWVDRAVGVVFVIAPFAFKFFGLDAWYYWVLAAAVLLTTSVFNAPEEPVATRSGLDRRAAG